MVYSNEQLENHLLDIESDWIERKESWSGDAPDSARKAVCAFANDLPDHGKPGILFIGARNDGKPSGLTVTDELLRTLSDIKTDGNILPLPSLFVEKRKLRGADVAVVLVHPSDMPPVRYKGRIWVRVGPRASLATEQDERILVEKRRRRNIPFDIQPMPTCNLSHLDRYRFESEYLTRAFSGDVLDANDRTYEQRLAACRMAVSADEAIPTVLGILVLGKSPLDWIGNAYVQFVRFDGTELSDPVIDESRFDGPIGQVLDGIDRKIDAHNFSGVDITSESREIRRSPYPKAALQQLIRNAVLHRTYEGTNAPVRVYWFEDRIEIANPGGPYGVVTLENFGRPGITDYRNPNLAEAMKVLGYVQRFGIGIPTAKAELKKNGNPDPEFEVDRNWVTAKVWRRP